MPSVYVAIIDQTYTNVIIAKKRVTNRWWKRGVKREGAVHQAGQWALPGGGGNSEDKAKGELLEETAYNLGDAHSVHTVNGQYYKLYVFRVDGIQAICDTINNSLRPGPGGNSPTNAAIKDWELSEVRVVSIAGVDSYLGERIEYAATREQQVLIDRMLAENRYANSIDWYGEMAQALKTLRTEYLQQQEQAPPAPAAVEAPAAQAPPAAQVAPAQAPPVVHAQPEEEEPPPEERQSVKRKTVREEDEDDREEQEARQLKKNREGGADGDPV